MMKSTRQLLIALALCMTVPLPAGPDLIKAAIDGKLDVVMERIAAGEKVNEVDKYGWTPLMWAVFYEQLPITEYLILNGADPNLQSIRSFRSFRTGSTALIIAARQGQDDQVAALMKAKPKLELKDESGKTAVAWARELQQHAVLKAMDLKVPYDRKLEELLAGISAGKDVNAVDQYGWTPLMWATYFGDVATAETFLEKGADPNLQSTAPFKTYPKGTTALTITGQNGEDRLTAVLVKKNAKVSTADSSGNTAESYARKNRYPAVLKVFGIQASANRELNQLLDGIAAGKSVNATDQYGWTPLMWAVYQRELSTVEYLLQKGADPNIQTTSSNKSIQRGATALIIAGYYGFDDIAVALFKGKAKTETKDASGKTASDYARKYGFSDVQNALLDMTPLKKNYTKIVLEPFSTGTEIPKDRDYRYAISECQFGALEFLNDRKGFETVEMKVSEKAYDASTLLVKVEIIDIYKDFSGAPPKHLFSKVTLVDAATGNVEREEIFADPNTQNGSPLTYVGFGSYWGSSNNPMGASINCAKDAGTAIANYLLTVCGKSLPNTAEPIQAAPSELIHQKEGFALSMLNGQKLAVWPIAYVDMDMDVASTVYAEYGNRNKFAEAMSAKLSSFLRGVSQAIVLDEKALTNLFSSEDSKGFLDPKQVLPWGDPKRRAAINPIATRFAALAKHLGLQGVRYAIIPRFIRMNRKVESHPGGWAPAPGPAGMGGGVIVGGGGSAKTIASLHLAIIDLTINRIVWDEFITASSSSLMLKATALHENEDELMSNLTKAIRKGK